MRLLPIVAVALLALIAGMYAHTHSDAYVRREQTRAADLTACYSHGFTNCEAHADSAVAWNDAHPTE